MNVSVGLFVCISLMADGPHCRYCIVANLPTFYYTSVCKQLIISRSCAVRAGVCVCVFVLQINRSALNHAK